MAPRVALCHDRNLVTPRDCRCRAHINLGNDANGYAASNRNRNDNNCVRRQPMMARHLCL